MRTTLTLDPDVARLIENLRKAQNLSLKEAVNRALRSGLTGKVAATRKAFKTVEADLGSCRLNRLDSVADALAIAEGEAFR